MTDEERLKTLLRAALPPVSTDGPSRDLWPAIRTRTPPVRWSWIDLGLAAAVSAVCVWQPGWFVWLAYHF